jgi:glycosyltransferase involved in cell wall biosynthesis
MRGPDRVVRCGRVRVGISLLPLASGEAGGSAASARQLVRALGAVGTLEYVVFVPAHDRAAASGLRAVDVHDRREPRRRPLELATYAVTAFRTRRVQTRADAVDALHYAVTNPVPRAEAPTVVTLHDSQHRDLPERFDPSRRSFRREEHDAAARAAEAIVVPTQFVRDRAIDRLGVGSERVHVIPPGVNHTLFRPGEDERELFLLYPARAWPHKNHARLFEAFAMLRKDRPRLRLVLAGDGLARLGPLPDGVERWGVVAPTELASLYRRAACVVYPSLYEGFALPPLEAMACGCVVAASNAAAIPEVCGGAAVLFDPLDPESIVQAILETDERRAELSELGLFRAAAFTWEDAARRHEEVYRSVAG